MSARSKATLTGAGKTVIGAFAVGLLGEWGWLPSMMGPLSYTLLGWAAGQILHSALRPEQWAELLGTRVD